MIQKIGRIALYIGLLLTVSVSHAQQLSQYTARYVQKANELAQNEQLEQAIGQLLKVETKRAFDKAYVSRMLGILYWQQGNSKNAINYLSQAVKSGALQDDQAWMTEKMLADLYLNAHKFQDAIKHYTALLSYVPEKQSQSEIWWRLAQSNYQLSQWKPVLSSIEHYKKHRGKMAQPQLSMQLGALLQLKRWKSSLPVLEALIELEPDNTAWWRQLTSLQLRLGRNKQALNTLALARLGNIELSDGDLRLLAQLYAQQKIPEQAALTLEQLDPNNQQQDLVIAKASYWQQAKEWQKATDSWLVAAKQQPKYYWEASQLMQQQRAFADSLKALSHLDPKQAKVALAKTQAYFKLGDVENALIEAKKADQYAANNGDIEQAKRWVTYLEVLRKQSQ
ncbi:tetratricopeptide repeat protein [Vibrio hippocampi]|uniref:Tetratricopeptide repeat protein n=1 Tax=Vibrio hippocampi TaxID=654686 RepID=A0ABM8ZLA6_9VIBR|nr:tetratricopeptide repeat protein [Vibrio hippocampi]CAH0529104.1 hypothetical protein VHP8226_03053 [Vibrio hippocampi]